MRHTWQNAPHLANCATLGKMWYSLKNGTTLGKLRHTHKNAPRLEKFDALSKMGHIQKMPRN